jgi:hypothetical protein
MPLFALVPFAFVFMVLGLDRAHKAELAALKKKYEEMHGRTPRGGKANDLQWLRKETAGKEGTVGRKGDKGDRGPAGPARPAKHGRKGDKGDRGPAGKDAKDVNINNTINNHYYGASTESSGSDSDSDTLSFDEPAAGGAAAGGAVATWNAFGLYSFAYCLSK